MNTYPAGYADDLCAIVESMPKGKMSKTSGYRRARNKLIREGPRGESGYAVFCALRACAWAEGADTDYLDLEDAQARHHYLGGGVKR